MIHCIYFVLPRNDWLWFKVNSVRYEKVSSLQHFKIQHIVVFFQNVISQFFFPCFGLLLITQKILLSNILFSMTTNEEFLPLTPQIQRTIIYVPVTSLLFLVPILLRT